MFTKITLISCFFAATFPIFAQAGSPLGLLVATENPGNVPARVHTVPGHETFYRANPAALEHGNITLGLPDGLKIAASRRQLVDNDGAYVWIGTIEGDDSSSVIIARRDGVLAGTILLDGRMYSLESVPGGLHRISEMQQEDPADEVTPVAIPDTAISSTDNANSADTTASHVMDVMVAYTQAAENSRGGNSQMLAHIDLAMAETNLAYQNSQIDAQLRLVHAVKVDYNESAGHSQALSDLRNTEDGYMDELHALRDDYGADLVSLIINNGEYCGIAYLGPSADYAFSVVHHSCATGYYSFGHEIGHNQGSMHDRANGSSNPVYPYSYGYQGPSSTFRTVMAYNCSPSCPRIQHFSNPDVTYGNSGYPTGIDYDLNPTDAADNARSINNTVPTVAAFRTQTVISQPPAAPGNLQAFESGHDRITLSWTDQSDNESGFTLERSDDGMNSWSVAANLSANTSGYVDSGLNASTQYSYRLRAYNSTSSSSWSDSATATTSATPTLPVAPTGIGAMLNSDNSVTVNWDHDGSNVAGFEILRQTRNRKGNWTKSAMIATTGTSARSITDTPDGGSIYRYGVRSINSAGISTWVFGPSVDVPKGSTGGGGSGKCHPKKGC